MIYRNIFKGIPWIDMVSPTPKEVKETMQEFSIDTDVADELLSPSLKPRIERHSDHLYLILHFPAFKQSHSNGTAQEIDIIINKDYIITARYDTIEAIESLKKDLEVEKIKTKADIKHPALFLFCYMFDHLYNASQYEIENATSRLDTIEEKIFNGMEKDMVFELSKFGREMLEFKQIIIPHKEVLKALTKEWKILFDGVYSTRIDRLVADYFKIKNTHRGLIDVMQELRATNDSLLTTKQNETVKVFTIIAFITFPLTLIAGIFGMNTASTPLVGASNDFWLIIGVMCILTLIMFLFFRIKKWL